MIYPKTDNIKNITISILFYKYKSLKSKVLSGKSNQFYRFNEYKITNKEEYVK